VGPHGHLVAGDRGGHSAPLPTRPSLAGFVRRQLCGATVWLSQPEGLLFVSVHEIASICLKQSRVQARHLFRRIRRLPCSPFSTLWTACSSLDPEAFSGVPTACPKFARRFPYGRF
jgi:hypothetical protein